MLNLTTVNNTPAGYRCIQYLLVYNATPLDCRVTNAQGMCRGENYAHSNIHVNRKKAIYYHRIQNEGETYSIKIKNKTNFLRVYDIKRVFLKVSQKFKAIFLSLDI